MFKKGVEAFGKVDILVNNAGARPAGRCHRRSCRLLSMLPPRRCPWVPPTALGGTACVRCNPPRLQASRVIRC